MLKKTIYLSAAAILLAASSASAAETSGAAARRPEQKEPAVISAGNSFAFKLYKRLATGDGNVFFSPYSITVALAMTLEGARGGTAAEMEKVLELPGEAARRKFFAPDLDGIGDRLGVDIANAFWADKTRKFLPRYVKLLKKDYKAAAFGADFASATEKARLEINAWTEKHTRGKIKDLFPENSLTTLTRLVLVDAIYFKGDWETAFDKTKTSEADFFTTPESTVTVSMMERTGKKARFNYAETDDLQLLELPYKKGGLSMLVILPAQDGLKKLEEALSPEKLAAWKSELHSERVDVFLPKFILKARYSLPETLAEMGMPTAFTKAADFSGMDGTKDLYIQQVVHQGFVEVNEEGTEAAAATGVSMALKSMPMPATQFRADRPFLFLIQEQETGRILFLGRVQKP